MKKVWVGLVVAAGVQLGAQTVSYDVKQLASTLNTFVQTHDRLPTVVKVHPLDWLALTTAANGGTQPPAGTTEYLVTIRIRQDHTQARGFYIVE